MRRIYGVAAIVILTGGIVLAPTTDSEPQPQDAAPVPDVARAAQPDFLNRIGFAPVRRSAPEGPSDEEAIRIAVQRGAELRSQRNSGANPGAMQPTTLESAPAPATLPGLTEITLDGAWSVTGTSVNLRAGPGTSHEVVGRAALGERMTPVGDTGGDWINARRADGQSVWIFAKFLKPADG